MSDAHAAARAIDALRRGWPIAITDGAERLVLLAIETADAARLAAFDPTGTAQVLLTAGRAATLRLANQRDAAVPDAPVTIDRAAWLDMAAATALADPQFDLATPMKGPYRAVPTPAPVIAQAALSFARTAGILPAFFVATQGVADLEIGLDDIASHDDAARLTIATRARLPVAGAEDGEIVAFRTPEMPGEHIALLIGAPNGQPPLVRLHSECLTGDVLGSLKCDCGPQLHAAIAAIEASGWGILLYLRQEGRGIGLANKLRAYALQSHGHDTVDANRLLGLPDDARDYGAAAAMLEHLGVASVRLVTNNPEKVKALRALGVVIDGRAPSHVGHNPHSAPYLEAKWLRMGHALPSIADALAPLGAAVPTET